MEFARKLVVRHRHRKTCGNAPSTVADRVVCGVRLVGRAPAVLGLRCQDEVGSFFRKVVLAFEVGGLFRINYVLVFAGLRGF
jgi:hypothetical protein